MTWLDCATPDNNTLFGWTTVVNVLAILSILITCQVFQTTQAEFDPPDVGRPAGPRIPTGTRGIAI